LRTNHARFVASRCRLESAVRVRGGSRLIAHPPKLARLGQTFCLARALRTGPSQPRRTRNCTAVRRDRDGASSLNCGCDVNLRDAVVPEPAIRSLCPSWVQQWRAHDPCSIFGGRARRELAARSGHDHDVRFGDRDVQFTSAWRRRRPCLRPLRSSESFDLDIRARPSNSWRARTMIKFITMSRNGTMFTRPHLDGSIAALGALSNVTRSWAEFNAFEIRFTGANHDPTEEPDLTPACREQVSRFTDLRSLRGRS